MSYYQLTLIADGSALARRVAITDSLRKWLILNLEKEMYNKPWSFKKEKKRRKKERGREREGGREGGREEGEKKEMFS